MRKIKFRGQDYYQGKWHNGSLTILTDSYGELNYFILEGNPEVPIIESDDFPRVRPDTVGQFTGLKDKNDNEIYEGDIATDGKYMYTVEFSMWSYAFVWSKHGSQNNFHFEKSDTEEMEVVGNIHDNPELIANYGKIY